MHHFYFPVWHAKKGREHTYTHSLVHWTQSHGDNNTCGIYWTPAAIKHSRWTASKPLNTRDVKISLQSVCFLFAVGAPAFSLSIAASCVQCPPVVAADRAGSVVGSGALRWRHSTPPASPPGSWRIVTELTVSLSYYSHPQLFITPLELSGTGYLKNLLLCVCSLLLSLVLYRTFHIYIWNRINTRRSSRPKSIIHIFQFSWEVSATDFLENMQH